MTDEKHEKVRRRAHELWESEGKPVGRDREHWHAAEKEISQANEGEGNRTAARSYNSKAEAFAKSGKVEAKAREAAEALNGPEGEALKSAERAGRKRSKGEDPLLGQ